MIKKSFKAHLFPILHDLLWYMLPALDLCYPADQAQLLITAGEELDYLDQDVSDLSVTKK